MLVDDPTAEVPHARTAPDRTTLAGLLGLGTQLRLRLCVHPLHAAAVPRQSPPALQLWRQLRAHALLPGRRRQAPPLEPALLAGDAVVTVGSGVGLAAQRGRARAAAVLHVPHRRAAAAPGRRPLAPLPQPRALPRRPRHLRCRRAGHLCPPTRPQALGLRVRRLQRALRPAVPGHQQLVSFRRIGCLCRHGLSALAAIPSSPPRPNPAQRLTDAHHPPSRPLSTVPPTSLIFHGPFIAKGHPLIANGLQASPFGTVSPCLPPP